MPASTGRRGALRTLLEWLLLGPLLLACYGWVLMWVLVYPFLWVPFLAIASQILGALIRGTRCTGCSRFLALTLVGRTSLSAVEQIGTEYRRYFDEHLECMFCGHRSVQTRSSAGSPPSGDDFVRAPAAERLCWLILALVCVGVTLLALWFTWARLRR